MEGKFNIFVLFTICVAVIKPILGNLDVIELTHCPIELSKYEKYVAYRLEAMYNASLIIAPKGLEETAKIQSEGCLKVKKAVSQYIAAVDLIKQKNCSAIPQIRSLEVAAILGEIDIIANVYSMIQDANQNNATLGEQIQMNQDEAWFERTKFLHFLFTGIKIVMAEACPGMLQIGDEISSDLLIAMMKETISGSESELDDIFYSILNVCKSSTSQKNCSLIYSYYREAYIANIAVLTDMFAELDEALSAIQNENGQTEK